MNRNFIILFIINLVPWGFIAALAIMLALTSSDLGATKKNLAKLEDRISSIGAKNDLGLTIEERVWLLEYITKYAQYDRDGNNMGMSLPPWLEGRKDLKDTPFEGHEFLFRGFKEHEEAKKRAEFDRRLFERSR